MSLKYALLGFIDVCPNVSGYDLKKYFDASLIYYWPATHSQIYRTLDELKAEGLITQHIINQEDKPNKKVYVITDKGQKNLTEWLKKPAELPVIRHTLLLKLSYASELQPTDIVDLLIDYREKVIERLKTYQNGSQEIVNHYARQELEKYLWQMCLDSGLTYYRGELEWLEKAIQKLQNRE